VVSLAGIINAIEIQGKDKETAKLVVNGAGAAAIASMKLLKKYGFKNITMCDTKGVIYKGRKEGMNVYKD
jgi:malic enzyme